MTESDQPNMRPADPWQQVPQDAAPPQPGPAAPGYPGYGYPPPGMMPYYYQGYQPRRTNGMAIAALVCGICGFIYLIPAILGIVFGIIGVRQTKRDGTDGRGMAIAGIITGTCWLALLGLIILIAISSAH